MNNKLTLYTEEFQNDRKEIKTEGYFWEKMELIFKIFRIMGYMPYEFDKHTCKLYMSFQAVLWAGFSSAVQVIVMTWGNKMEFDSEENFKSYVRTLFFTLRLLNTNTILFYLATWWEMPKIIRYVNKWLEFEANLKSVKGTPTNSLTSRRLMWIVITFTAVTILIIAVDQVFFYKSFRPFLLFTYFFSVYMNLLYNLFWIFNCVFIAQMASSLRHSLVNMLRTKPDRNLINSYRLLWIQLRDQVNEFSGAIRLPFVTHLFINHIALIFSMYALMTSVLNSDETEQIIYFFIPQLWTATTLVSICESAHYLCQEIGQKFISKVLFEKAFLHDLNTMKEVDLLLETMEKNSPEIVLGGCISVGRVLLIQTISAEITYNIVLSQFDVDRS